MVASRASATGNPRCLRFSKATLLSTTSLLNHFLNIDMIDWIYILECADGSYYNGSTNNMELRLSQHQAGKGANHTRKRLPVKLVYCEEYSRIDEAFIREKQVQGWSRKKKEALISGAADLLPELAIAYRDLK